MKQPKRPTPPPAVATAARDCSGKSTTIPPSASTDRWRIVGGFTLVLLATLIAYLPCLNGTFLWDDLGHVTNPALQSLAGLRRIWFEPGATQQYYPLLHSAFWIEHRIWGDSTLGYHLVNVLWHATSACLLITILRRLALPGALLAGLLFALHPVEVESVAWISEQKNTLSTVFCLAAALAYLRCAQNENEGESERTDRSSQELAQSRSPHSPVHFHWGIYFIATAFFACALLTKTVTATLPGALLVLSWWRRGRLSWRNDVVPLLPWFLIGAAAGFTTSWFERTQIGATGGDFTLTMVERCLLAGRVVWFYLGKLVWPAGLSFFYPRWTIDAAVAWQWLFPAATLAALAVAGWWSRRNRGPLAAALLFGGTLFPVLGFVNVYPFVFSYVADHFQYLASLAFFAFLSAIVTRQFARLAWPRWSGPAIAIALLLTVGALTWRQSEIYRDVFSLYETTVARNPSSWVAQLNLGTALADAGRVQESLPHLQRARELKPDFPETLNSLGNVLNRLERPAEARPLLEQALRIQPRFAAAHNTLGVVLMTLGQSDAGIASFQRALEINPNLALARVNLGWALANSGRVADAVAQFEQAQRLQPDSAEAEFKWGLTYALNSRTPEAVPHFIHAVELQPDDADIHHALARALLEVGRPAEAAAQFEATLRLNPNHTGAREGLDLIRQR